MTASGDMNYFQNTAQRNRFVMAAAALVLVGFWLRLHGARGDLWLDEVWSLALVARIHSVGAVFWGINHDNNHFLNSIWLYWVGPDASVLTYRLPAILLGTAGIPAAGWVVRRHGPVPMLAVMLLFSVNYLLVDYGSQARGYAGLILFTLLAIGCTMDALALPRPTMKHRAPWLLGLVMTLGFLSHLVMGEVAVIVAIWSVRERLSVVNSVKQALLDTVVLLTPTAILMSPLVFCLLTNADEFAIGHQIPFVASDFWRAYGYLLLVLLGSNAIGKAACLGVVALLYCAVGYAWISTGRRETRYSTALVLVPLIFFGACLPNTSYPRYFLPFGVIFLLHVGECMGLLLTRDTIFNPLSVIIVLAIVGLNMHLLLMFFAAGGRGDYTALASRMAATGTILYGTTQPEAVRAALDYYGRKLGVPAEQVPMDQWCKTPPNWFVFTELYVVPPDAMAEGVIDKCGYDLQAVPFPNSGMTNSGWHVFHRVSQAHE